MIDAAPRARSATCPAAVRSVTHRVRALLLLAALLAAGSAHAQQFVTDDATVVELRACQLEAWHGESESWLLPACRPFRSIEITVGAGFIAEHGRRAVRPTLEGKLLLRESAPGSSGVALVTGAEFSRPAHVSRTALAAAFAYVPVSASIGADRVLLHVNAGWRVERNEHEHDGEVHRESHHAPTWAARADLPLPGAAARITLVGEVHGEARAPPGYQLGLRSTLRPDRITADLSWGGQAGGASGAGWTLGASWTPPPLLRTQS